MSHLKTSRGLCAALLLTAVQSVAEPVSTALNQTTLSGADGMKVITALSEYQPGDTLRRHLHHGVEAAYVVQGASIQAPGKAPIALPEGSSLMNLRDVPHGGFTVVGDQALKIFTVHIIDSGKPVYEWLD